MEIAPLAQLKQTQKLLEYVNKLLPELMKEVGMSELPADTSRTRIYTHTITINIRIAMGF